MPKSDTFKNLQNQYFNLEHKEIRSIYVDMELLQDLRLGALFTMLKVKSEMRYIYTKLNDYNNRLDNELCSYFPALKFTEQNILDRLADDKHSLRICGMSPFTAAYDYFLFMLMEAIKHNNNLGKVLSINICVNVSDIHYSKVFYDMFVKNISVIMPTLNFSMHNYTRYQYPVDEFRNFDMLFLYDIRDLLQNNDTMAMLFMQQGVFFDKEIYSPPYIDKTLHTDPNEYTKILTSTASGLDMFCNFKYLNRNINFKETKS